MPYVIYAHAQRGLVIYKRAWRNHVIPCMYALNYL